MAIKCVAATITISFVAMLPIETETIVEAQIESVEGRKIQLRSTIKNPSGQIVAEGSGLFIVLREEQLRALEPSSERFRPNVRPNLRCELVDPSL